MKKGGSLSDIIIMLKILRQQKLGVWVNYGIINTRIFYGKFINF